MPLRSAHSISFDANMTLTSTTPAIPGYHRDTQGKQGKSYRWPFTTPGLRETIVEKIPCLGAYALGGLEPPTI